MQSLHTRMLKHSMSAALLSVVAYSSLKWLSAKVLFGTRPGSNALC